MPDGQRQTGSYQDDKPNGVWVIRDLGDVLAIGSYKDGLQDGIWAFHTPDGRSDTGPYKNGQKNGVWTLRMPDADGRHQTGSYQDDKKVGEWTIEPLKVTGIDNAQRMFPPGSTTAKIYFSEGQAGVSRILCPGGLEAEGYFLESEIDDNGDLQGKWQFLIEDIREEQGRLKDSVKQGVWEIKWLLDNTTEKGTYVDGLRHGEWVIRREFDGMTEKGNYEHGWRNGEWVVEYEDGQVEIGNYDEGLRHGRWRIYWPDGMEAKGNMSKGIRMGRWRLKSRYGWEQEANFVKKNVGEGDISVRVGDWRYFRNGKAVDDWEAAAEKKFRFYDVIQEAAEVELFVYGSGGEVYMGTLLADYGAERKENVDRRFWGNRLAHGEWMERISWLGRDQDRAGAWALEKARYDRGVLEGTYEVRLVNGYVTIGIRRKNERSGMWVTRGPNGSVRYAHYASGVRQGPAFLGYADGVEEYGRFIGGKRHGEWVVRFPNGDVRIGGYENGRKTDHWILYSADGTKQ